MASARSADNPMKAEECGEFLSSFEIGKVKVGCHNSQLPTVLIGSIFYMRHKIVKDDQEGKFDEIAAAKLIEKASNLANSLRLSLMLDVIGATSKALIRYIKFVKKVSDVPILINSTSPETRVEAVKELAEDGLLDDIVYNSINHFSTEEEIQALASLPIEAAVVQAYNLRSKSPNSPLKALIGDKDRPGLLDAARRCNIVKIMVDIPTLDMASIGALPYSAKIITEKLQLPVGTAPANATYASAWLKDRSRSIHEDFRVIDATASAYLVANRFDFLFFGPIEGGEWILPACALVDALNAYGDRYLGQAPAVDRHPMHVVL